MNRISKATREQAALICAIAASGGFFVDVGWGWTRVYTEIRDQLGLSAAASSLAIRAYSEVRSHPAYRIGWPVEVDAEAEALLRTGWSP